MEYVCIKYSMCDLICDVITCSVWSCDMGKINTSDKIITEKDQYGNKRYFYIILHLKDRLDIEFTACLGEVLPQEALTSFTVSDAYRYFHGQT